MTDCSCGPEADNSSSNENVEMLLRKATLWTPESMEVAGQRESWDEIFSVTSPLPHSSDV